MVTVYGAESGGPEHARVHVLPGDSREESVQAGFSQAVKRGGPVHVLVVNRGPPGTADGEYPLWDLPMHVWEQRQAETTHAFVAIKHFLRAAGETQQTQDTERSSSLSIVIVGQEPGNTGFVADVQDKLAQGNRKARINAIMPQGRSRRDTARCTAFLASPRAGHITGQCLTTTAALAALTTSTAAPVAVPATLEPAQRNRVRVALTIDLDAVSGWLGTGHHPDNVLADYSAGFFAARVGVPRLLRMLQKLDIASRCTWFIPGHSAESFPEEVQQVVDSGAEIGLHGYAHESAYQLTAQQERDILVRCMDIATDLTGTRPVGYRAPLYQVRESTLDLLEEFGFEYDASLTDHDCHPFYAPRRPPLQPIDYARPASSWMHPVPSHGTPPDQRKGLVCLPANWYMEDMTPLQFLPHVPNSQGYTDVRIIENMWRDRFLWIRDNEPQPVFPLVVHPDTSGMAHVIGMLERVLAWLKGFDDVEFCTCREVVRRWKKQS